MWCYFFLSNQRRCSSQTKGATNGAVLLGKLFPCDSQFNPHFWFVTLAMQDPICFRGTVRSNLDPFMEYSDLAMVSTSVLGFQIAVGR